MYLKNSVLVLTVLLIFVQVSFADPVTYPIGVVIGTGKINIRKNPNEVHLVIGQAAPGTRFAVQQKGTWFVLLDGPFAGGCIHQDYMKMTGQKFPILQTYNAKIPVYASPDVKSKVLGTLNSDILMAGSLEKNFYRIQDGKYNGAYISVDSARFLDKTIEQDTTGNSTKVLPDKNAEAQANPEKKWSDAEEQRFQDQVFKAFEKKKIDQKVEVQMPIIYFDQKPIQVGTIPTTVTNDTQVAVGAPFFEVLKKLIVSEWFERKEIKDASNKVFQNRELISLSVFDNSGVDIKFDEKKLLIQISIPPELRLATTASLGKTLFNDENSNIEPPSGFSTYFNFSGTEVFDSRSVAYDDRRNPLRAQIENGTNILGVVLEANASYIESRNAEQGSSGFRREDIRLVKDFPAANTRVSLGDVIFPVRTFQIYRPMGGIAATTTFGLNSSKLTYPTGRYEIFLKNPSKVYVWVNEQMHQVLDLPSGRHTLQDFPFTTGMNDVRLEIVDEMGRTETLNYSQFSSTELLRPGLHQFTYAYGNPSRTEGNQRLYDSGNGTYSAFHKYGLSENTTLGANVQGDSNQSILGVETTLSSEYGYFHFEPSFSQGFSDTGYAALFQYSYVDYLGTAKTQRTFNMSLAAKSEKFASLGSILGRSENPTIAELSLGSNRGLSKSLSLNMGGSYRFNRKTSSDTVDSYAINAGINKRWENNINVNVNARHSHSERGVDEIGVWLFFLWTEPKSHQTITATHSASDDSNRVDWNYNPSTGVDSAAYTASFHNSKDTQGYSGQVNYTGNRFRGSVQHEVLISSPVTKDTATGTSSSTSTQTAVSKKSDHVTTLQFASSLVYAGGYFGVGRPVVDSFAIFAPIKNLKGQRIDVNPDKDDNYTAKSDWLGPAVLPEIGSYNFSTIVLGGKHVTNSQGLPRDHFDLKPTYKSGYGFGIGTDATMYLNAKIVMPDGSVLENATARAIYVDDASIEPVIVFTNRKGILRAEGFRQGKYRLEVGDNQFQPVEFVIKESSENIFDLGTVQLKTAQ